MMGRTHQFKYTHEKEEGSTGNGGMHEREGGGGSKQRYAEKYRQWQELKNHQRNSEHHLLQKKVVLQHQLIEANDKLHQKRQLEDDLRQLQLRDARKKEKAMQRQSLMNTCQQSLETEKHKRLTDRHKLKTNMNHTLSVRANQHLPTIGNREQMMIETYPHSSMEVDKGTIEEEEEDEEQDEDFEDQEEHEYQLQKMFGKRQANYFLRPRIEPEKKKQIHIPPAVRRKGGRAGATTLWTILREKTSMKLQKTDSQIPEELKDAYGAFVRECLTKNKMVVKRSFYSGNGVPETERLQDGSYRKKVGELRHNIELMYRSAHNNRDKTAILMFNNPLPDFSDRNGVEGPMRYYPSWIANAEEIAAVPAYQKWVDKCSNVDDEIAMQDECSTNHHMEPLLAASKHHHPNSSSKKTTKLSFLSEADATCDGQFWASRRENIDNEDDILSKHSSTVRNKSKSTKEQHQDKNKRRSRTAPIAVNEIEAWQPLSLAALTEYKPTVQVLAGTASFSHGHGDMWRPILANESSKKSKSGQVFDML